MSEISPASLTDEAVAEEVARLIGEAERAGRRGERFLLGIAGVAGSGKSTLAQRLVEEVNRDRPGFAVFAPMDGFHLLNEALESQGTLGRKGAPFTYDAAGFVSMLAGYRRLDSQGPVPVYCREAHAPVPSVEPVTSSARLLVAEGQYLLLTEPPWSRLAGVLDETWWLDTPEDVARRWTIGRHVRVGRSPEEARQKYAFNDGPNSELARRCRRPWDRAFVWG